MTVETALKRLAQAGPNTLTSRDREPWYLLFLQQFANPLVYILIGAAVIKGYFRGMVDAAVIAAVLLLMAIIGFVQEMKARRAMEALLRLSAPRTKVRRDGMMRVVDTAEVISGDILVIEAAGIGVAMGITGTDVAKEAADMVLADDNFASIVAAVEDGRIVFNRLRNVTFFLLMTCASELMTLFLSVALYGESPLEPIQILWVNLVTGGMVAIPLGLEPGTGRELSQPPRDPSVGLLYPGMLLRLGLTGLCMSMLITWIFHHAPLPLGVDGVTAHEVRQTTAFTGIVVFEWLFAFQARSTETGFFRVGVFRNPWLLFCMVLGLALQVLVVYLPAANTVFHTHPLTAEEWAWTLLPGVVAVSLESLRKRFAPQLFSRGQWRLSKQER